MRLPDSSLGKVADSAAHDPDLLGYCERFLASYPRGHTAGDDHGAIGPGVDRREADDRDTVVLEAVGGDRDLPRDSRRRRWIIGGVASMTAGTAAFVSVFMLGSGDTGNRAPDRIPSAIPSAVAGVVAGNESGSSASPQPSEPASASSASDSLGVSGPVEADVPDNGREAPARSSSRRAGPSGQPSNGGSTAPSVPSSAATSASGTVPPSGPSDPTTPSGAGSSSTAAPVS